jgi:hypothetical protein
MPKFGEKSSNPLVHAKLCELLTYTLETGKFTWNITRPSYAGKVKPGVEAGTLDKYGHRMIVINGLTYPAHRLAWYVHQKWPTGQIDHKNMVRDDNRIANLREASRVEQRANQRVRRDSACGIKGVSKTRHVSWQATIRKNGITYYLGKFKSPHEAHSAYITKARELFGEFARGE